MAEEKFDKVHKKSYGIFDMIRRQRNTNNASQLSALAKGIIVFITVLILFLIVTSGIINQKATGQNLIAFSKSWGKDSGAWITKLFKGEGPLSVTKDGVYLKNSPINKGSVNEVKDAVKQ